MLLLPLANKSREAQTVKELEEINVALQNLFDAAVEVFGFDCLAGRRLENLDSDGLEEQQEAMRTTKPLKNRRFFHPLGFPQMPDRKMPRWSMAHGTQLVEHDQGGDPL